MGIFLDETISLASILDPKMTIAIVSKRGIAEHISCFFMLESENIKKDFIDKLNTPQNSIALDVH